MACWERLANRASRWMDLSSFWLGVRCAKQCEARELSERSAGPASNRFDCRRRQPMVFQLGWLLKKKKKIKKKAGWGDHCQNNQYTTFVCLPACRRLHHGTGFKRSPHLPSSLLGVKLLRHLLPRWPRASLPDFFSEKSQSHSKCASLECFVIFFFLMGVLPLKNPNWFLGDEMLLLAPTTSEFLQTVLFTK